MTNRSQPEIKVFPADLDVTKHARAFLDLTASYMADAMGGGAPWTDGQSDRVLQDLREHPAAVVFLARADSEYVGVCTCFYGYSTFLAGGLYNIHDIYVSPACRGRGIARKMLHAVEQLARKSGAIKITLEVREDNKVARTLYLKEGYGPADPPMLFWAKMLRDR